jgi:hypothetical protein
MEKLLFNCLKCGKPIKNYPSWDRKYCSYKCAHIGRCTNTGKTHFKKGQVPWNKGKHPEHKVYKEYEINVNNRGWFTKERLSGEKNPRWNGGSTKFRQVIRELDKYKQWRSNVFQRDNWTCQTCGKRGHIIHVHHIKEFERILKENNIKDRNTAISCSELWNLNNGVTLCEECHRLVKHHRG